MLFFEFRTYINCSWVLHTSEVGLRRNLFLFGHEKANSALLDLLCRSYEVFMDCLTHTHTMGSLLNKEVSVIELGSEILLSRRQRARERDRERERDRARYT